MVEAVQRYSNLELNILYRLKREINGFLLKKM